MAWCTGVKGVLLDVTGVLYNSGPSGGTVIDGSVDAIRRLSASDLPFKLCSNESTQTREDFVAKLNRHGFNLTVNDILCPAPAMAALLKQKNLRPYLLVYPNVLPEFSSVCTENPNCVVVGDCQDYFTYSALNKAFNILLTLPPEERMLFSLGAGKFYNEGGELVLDVGSYAKMLEYSSDCSMIICGKPSETFYTQAVNQLGVDIGDCVMIGDDIVSDVGGAQALGMKGVQVRTGKYRAATDEPHSHVKPDGYVNNLAEAVELLLKNC